MEEVYNRLNSSRLRWLHWVEPWFLSYALAGVTAAGLIPILLPLVVIKSDNATEVGLVVAAVNLGGLSAALWGTLADRYRLHRWLLLGGLWITAASLILFSMTSNPALWLSMALLQGAGIAAASTVANLFVVESHPEVEWNERIGWLQTFYGSGQVIGLLIAGLVGQLTNSVAGLYVAAAFSALAGLVGWFTTHLPERALAKKPVLLHPSRSGEWSPISPQSLFHHLSGEAIRQFSRIRNSALGFFLVTWFMTFGGAASVFSLYPIIMKMVFQVPPGISSSVFALAAGVGLFLYSPAGAWSDRFGDSRVFRAGLGVRLAAFAVLLSLGLLHAMRWNWLALASFALVVMAWSLLSVSGTALIARFSPGGEGAGMGLFSATSALAGVVGAGLGGFVASRWGYSASIFLAVVGISLGLFFDFLVRFQSHRLFQESRA